jgi:hypothetical protein
MLGMRNTCRITHWKRHKAERRCQPLFVLRNQVFWFVALCGWELALRQFEETYRYPLHVYIQE